MSESPAARATLSANAVRSILIESCSGDIELRSEVHAPLRHHLETGRFLAPLSEEAVKQEPTPNSIGPYVIGRLLGEGGMGTVYLAVQAEPFRREVALKLIRPGMGSKSVIARFEAERRTLAMMDHPNIAHVNMGRHEDAVLLDETVWATQRRVLGEEHPDTLDTVESLAELYAPTEPARAEVLYKQAADGYRRTLGARHGNAILAVINLAQFWIDEKKFAQAELLLRQELDALGGGETGDDPMYRYRLMTLLGYASAGLQRWSTAEPLLRDGYEGLVRNASVAQDQEDVADAGELVIQAYTQWGKQPAATAEWKQRVAGDRIRLATLKP
jgi:hypothetical protein